jgi:hypothetical protein
MMIMITDSHPGPTVSRVAETRRFPAPPDRDLPCQCAADAHAVASRSRWTWMRFARHGPAGPAAHWQPPNSDTARGDPPAANCREHPGIPGVGSCVKLHPGGTELQALRGDWALSSGPGPDSSGESEAGESEPPSHRDGASVCHGATCELEAAGTRGVSDRQPRGPRRGHQLSGLVA